jgi:hypothetical protein
MVMRLKCLVLASIVALPAEAETMREALFPGDDGCFARVYDTAHLRNHPDQQVTAIWLAPDLAETSRDVLAVRVGFTLRASEVRFNSTAYCREEQADLSCGIEGDGGTFALTAQGDGVHLTIGPDDLFIEGEAQVLDLSGTTGDDRVFQLQPGPCTE